jgi:adenylosuccinate synthase
MAKIYMIAGLGFGDEGKGTITEYLTVREGAHTIVRYNGGAQAAHNVVLEDGRHHTFSQFGSGTLTGAATHLSRFMIIDPVALRNEASALSDLGVSNPFELLTVERGAPLITPYQKGANRLRELLRGSGKHGSCGAGVGETVSDHLTYGEAVPKIEDLFDRVILGDKISFIRDLKMKEFTQKNLFEIDESSDRKMFEAFKLLTMPVNTVLDLWQDVASNIRLVDKDHLQKVIDSDSRGSIIFEGAQGVLLDQTWGFHPHTTWTDITFDNADALLNDLRNIDKVEKIGVIRTYMTRHGTGPFPTEIRGNGTVEGEKFNRHHDWQGGFRVGWFDMMLFQYALDVIGPIDSLALTHIDYLPNLRKMCVSYDSTSSGLHEFMADGRLTKREDGDLEYQERLGKAIERMGTKYNYWPVNDNFVDVLEDIASIKVSILSRGPTRQDKLRQ